MFYNRFKQYENNKALISIGESYTYKDIINSSDILLSALSKKGLVAVIAGNNYETICGYVSFLHNKNPLLLLNFQDNINHLKNIIDTYKPAYIYADKDIYSQLNIELNSLCSLNSYSLYETCYNQDYKIDENICLLLTTSGSTGSVKYVKLTYDNMLSNTESIIDYLKISQKDVTITNLPFSYSYGLSVINTYLYQGASIVLTNSSVIQKEFWDLFKAHSITSLSGVPYTYEMFKRIGLHRIDLSSLKVMTQAGGRLSDDLLDYFIQFTKEKDILFYIMYGQTEATARMSYLDPKYLESKKGSIGKALLNGELKIFTDDLIEVKEPNIEGEIVYKGKNVFAGYAESFKDLSYIEKIDTLYTGDKGFFDKDKFFFITGRKKRIVKIYGYRVNLDDIEKLLYKHNIKSACVGSDNNISIYIQDDFIEEDVKKLLELEMMQAVRSISLHKIDKIPYNSNGKIDYAGLINDK